MHVDYELDKANQEKFLAGADSEDAVFNCVFCGRAVSISGSYSCQGKNLICISCARKAAKANHQMSVGEWLTENIWRKKE